MGKEKRLTTEDTGRAVRHEGERQKKAMSKFNHQSPARWVLCPLLPNPKCTRFARWTFRKPHSTARERNLPLLAEERLRLLRGARGLYPSWGGRIPRRSEVDAPSTRVPSGCPPACVWGRGCAHPSPYSPPAPLRVQLPGTPTLGWCIPLHASP